MHKFLKLITVLFILFSGISISNAQNFDINVLKQVHTNTKFPSDKTCTFLSNSVTPLAFTLPVAMFFTGLSTHNKDLQIKSIESGTSILVASAISYSIKISVKRPRPYATYPNLITKKGHGSTYSFPSGHTTTSFAIATSLSLAFPKWYVIIPSFTFASAVAYSRMRLGMHYPTDLLAGIIIGMGTSFLSFQTNKWLNKKYNF